MKTSMWATIVAIGYLGLSAGTALASPIGTLDITNCAGGGVTVTLTTIVFSPNGSAPNTGCIVTGISTSVTYSTGTLSPGALGDIMDLTAGGGAVNDFMTFPPLVPGPVALDFVLNSLGPGVASTACGSLLVGQSCSVDLGSPFILTATSSTNTSVVDGTTVTLAAAGTVSDSAGSSNWFGQFSVSLNQTPGTIQSTINAGGSVSTTNDGKFTLSTAVPEPDAAWMIGFGLIGVGALIRRRIRS